MLDAALAAMSEILTPPFRRVLYKILGLTLVLLALVWVGLDKVVISYVAVPYPWLATMLSILTGLGLFLGLAFLVAPVSMLVAGFFLDELAERVEFDTTGATGQALPGGQAIWLASKFALVSVLVNLLALLVLLLPGVNIVAFFVANAYLFGREYFELAALRYRPIEEVREMRRRHRLYIFLCGFFVAAVVAVPIVNLLTPLFGTAFMVRIHQRLSRQERGVMIQAGR
ncbi:MAG: conserved rane protein of unknown function [Hyphomicrobiales bacterium]|nr:conserved rane protein of unknown function [Hyphomicrobiales bacterium]